MHAVCNKIRLIPKIHSKLSDRTLPEAPAQKKATTPLPRSRGSQGIRGLIKQQNNLGN
jgi:hypothetical protein